jgi:hypothetical protein
MTFDLRGRVLERLGTRHGSEELLNTALLLFSDKKRSAALMMDTNYCMCWPPLIAMLAPVTKAASSEHR